MLMLFRLGSFLLRHMGQLHLWFDAVQIGLMFMRILWFHIELWIVTMYLDGVVFVGYVVEIGFFVVSVRGQFVEGHE